MSKNRLIIVLSLFALLLLAGCGGDSTASRTDSSESVGSRTDSAPGDEMLMAAAGQADTGPALPKLAPNDGPAARGASSPTVAVAAVCLSPEEAELARLINEYRATKGLPAIPISKSLTLVAQQHAWDSVNNSNAWPAPPAGQECNMHSWSGNVNPALQGGTWTAVCYTPDHANMNGMHRKPREIAGYTSDGFENSHWSSAGATPAGALNGWQNSPGHNAVITEQNGWGPFLALGVGMNGQFAHMWVGQTADPAGAPPLCAGGAAAPVATTAPVATAVPAATTAPVATTAPEATAAPAQPTEAPAAQPTATTAPAATGEILNQAGTVATSPTTHTFNVAANQRVRVVITPSAQFDVAAAYTCTTGNSSQSATIDSNWEGTAESFAIVAPNAGSCTVTVSGYNGSTGDYTIVVATE